MRKKYYVYKNGNGFGGVSEIEQEGLEDNLIDVVDSEEKAKKVLLEYIINANIYSEAKITLNSNCTTDDEPIHSIEFDGVVADIIGAEPTKREIEIFKIGILYERERLWDESVNLVDDKTMRKLLRYK